MNILAIPYFLFGQRNQSNGVKVNPHGISSVLQILSKEIVETTILSDTSYFDPSLKTKLVKRPSLFHLINFLFK